MRTPVYSLWFNHGETRKRDTMMKSRGSRGVTINQKTMKKRQNQHTYMANTRYMNHRRNQAQIGGRPVLYSPWFNHGETRKRRVDMTM